MTRRRSIRYWDLLRSCLDKSANPYRSNITSAHSTGMTSQKMEFNPSTSHFNNSNAPFLIGERRGLLAAGDAEP